MHVVIEKARKSAGISGLKKNYPDDPKQRGCGYWAAFIGSIGNDLATMDQHCAKVVEESKDLARRIAELEHELNAVRSRAAKNGVEALRHQENWSIDKGQEVLKQIAG